MIGVATSFNAMTEHGTCTVVFVAVGAILTFLVSVIQTLDRISWIGWIGVFGILSAVITLTISVGVQDRPDLAPDTGPWDKDLRVFGSPTFLEAMGGVSTIVFSFAGAPNYFGIISELREPKNYKKSFLAAQVITAGCYLVSRHSICSSVVTVSREGLQSTELISDHRVHGLPLCRAICLFPRPRIRRTVDEESMLRTRSSRSGRWSRSQHTSASEIRLCQDSGQKSPLDRKYLDTPSCVDVSLGTTLESDRLTPRACVLGNCAISFIIAESIPVFNDIIGLIGAVLANPLSLYVLLLTWHPHLLIRCSSQNADP